MPEFDGKGPLGQGPMTGRGQGFCILKTSGDDSQEVEGFAGIIGKPVGKMVKGFRYLGKEMINMPGGDRTGPLGLGPMTGRAAGFCAGYPVPGYTNSMFGRGYWGWGRGFRGGGRGRRNWYYATGLPGWARAGYGWPAWGGYAGGVYGNYPIAYPGGFPTGPTAEQEQQALKQQSKYMQQSLDDINKRIEELEKEKQEV